MMINPVSGELVFKTIPLGPGYASRSPSKRITLQTRQTLGQLYYNNPLHLEILAVCHPWINVCLIYSITDCDIVQKWDY